MRTVERVIQLTSPDSTQADISDVLMVASVSYVADLLPLDSPSLTDCDSSRVTGSVSNAETVLSSSSFDNKTVLTGPTFNPPVTAPVGHPQMRTRLGRLVKPVNRLIQNMSRQDVVPDTFNVKDVCRTVFQTLTG
ncbi:unnamed protein product [Knipowitschia caucasica]